MALADSSTVKTTGEIRSFNTIRGVAALAVAVFHAKALFGVGVTLPHAYLAVDLFFVLSGFVMVHAYETRIATGLGFGRFMQLRLARLYPLLAIATLIGFGLSTLMMVTGHGPLDGATPSALAANLVLLPAGAGVAYPFCSQSWSIFWEVALCAVLFAGFRWRHGAVFVAVIAAAGLLLVAISQGKIDGGWTGDTFWIGGLRALFGFSIGAALRLAPRERALPTFVKYLAPVVALAAVAYIALVNQTFWWADYLVVAIAFPLIITSAATGGRLLENWVGDRLGEASYSIYLLHGFTIVVLGPVGKLARHFGLVAGVAFDIAWIGGVVVMAWCSWRWVETPLRQWASGLNLSRGRTTAPLLSDRVA